MSIGLSELFARYNQFFDRLEVDNPALRSRRIRTLEKFEELWIEVRKDPQLEGRWLMYLGPGGYECYRAECVQEAEDFLRLLGV